MRDLKYCRCAVICHGLSERRIVSYIKSNLHLKLEIFSNNKGQSSIQITSVLNFIKQFKSLKTFADRCGIEYKNKKLVNFKLFIIMDTDDCTEKEKNSFLDKSMFKAHPLYDYIYPIYNSPKLENVLHKAKIMTTMIKDNIKGTYYFKAFPINKGILSMNSYNEIELFKKKLELVNSTNMDEFVEYCLSLV
ncbi:hypothetical protein J6Y73_03240 [bacterium]|nr:hypothetical protein [bacterium]